MGIDFTGDFIRSSYISEKHPEKVELTGEVVIDGKSYLVKIHHRLGAEKTGDIQKIVQEELKKLSSDELKHLTQKKFKADFFSKERAGDPLLREVIQGAPSKKEYSKVADWKKEKGEPKEAVNTLFIRLFELKQPKTEAAKAPASTPQVNKEEAEKVSDTSETIAKMREEMANLFQKHASDVSKEVSILHQKITDLESSRSEMDIMREAIGDQAQEFSFRLKELKNEIEKLKRSYKVSQEASQGELINRLQGMLSEHILLVDEVITGIQNKMELWEESRGNSRANSEADLEALKEKLALLQKRLDEVPNPSQSSNEGKIERLLEEIEKQAAEIADLKAKLDKLSQKDETAREEVRTSSPVIEASKPEKVTEKVITQKKPVAAAVKFSFNELPVLNATVLEDKIKQTLSLLNNHKYRTMLNGLREFLEGTAKKIKYKELFTVLSGNLNGLGNMQGKHPDLAELRELISGLTSLANNSKTLRETIASATEKQAAINRIQRALSLIEARIPS